MLKNTQNCTVFQRYTYCTRKRFTRCLFIKQKIVDSNSIRPQSAWRLIALREQLLQFLQFSFAKVAGVVHHECAFLLMCFKFSRNFILECGSKYILQFSSCINFFIKTLGGPSSTLKYAFSVGSSYACSLIFKILGERDLLKYTRRLYHVTFGQYLYQQIKCLAYIQYCL